MSNPSARDFSRINIYLNELQGDVYSQPPDKGHTVMIREAFQNWVPQLMGVKNVLDIGCGEVAIAEPFFKQLNMEYTGITLGLEAIAARRRGKNVLNMDMSFLEFDDQSYDLLWARHVAEHSPMPLLTLMEWHRVCKMFLCLIVPKPEFYGRTGRNHYSVLFDDQWEFLLERAGFHVIWRDHSNQTEYRFMAERK